MSWIDLLANIPTNAVLRQRIQELTAEFEKMEARIMELERENADLRAKFPSGELHEIEISILELLGRAGDYVHKDQFAPHLRVPSAKAEHYLQSLDEKGYLRNSINLVDGISYKLSQKGSKYSIDTRRL